MSVADISILSSVGALLLVIAGAVGLLYRKLKIAVGKIIITDENGKVRSVKIIEIFRIVMSAVSTAEETGKKGAEKKEIALKTIQATLDAMNANYDIEELSKSIDTLVGLINAFIKKSKK